MPKRPRYDLRNASVSKCTPDLPREGELWFRGYVVTVLCATALGALLIVSYN